jgi:hypothetical protein
MRTEYPPPALSGAMPLLHSRLGSRYSDIIRADFSELSEVSMIAANMITRVARRSTFYSLSSDTG